MPTVDLIIVYLPLLYHIGINVRQVNVLIFKPCLAGSQLSKAKYV